MSGLRKFLLAILLIAMVTVILVTWGSIGSAVLTLGLLLALGAIALNEHPDLHEKQIVYFLSEAYKGCGYTKEAVKALSDEALKCKDIPYVIIVADDGNASQQRVAEKTGFGLYEKRVSVAERLSGVTGDVYLYFRKY